jgi:hypothetical protein
MGFILLYIELLADVDKAGLIQSGKWVAKVELVQF